MTVPQITQQALQTAAQAAQDKQATDIIAVDVAERLGITDAFFIATAESDRQVSAVVEEIEDRLREKHQISPRRREGQTENRWVLLDYGHFVVHVQHEEERALYGLDRLWRDSPSIDLGLPTEVQDSPKTIEHEQQD